MATPEHDDKPASSPLNAEREKLRKAGYNDAEISQILVARALGSSGPAADATSSQGVLSGPISSVVAIGSYARGTVFTIRHDLATIFDGTALASARVAAAAMLVFKVAVISVLAFAGWQEWRQHIISAPEIAKGEAQIKQETSRNAPVLQSATAEGAAADAEIKKATALEALRRQKAEADEAVERAAKVKAEACSARAEANAKNIRFADFLNGNYRGDEALARDCDPNYAKRQACDEKFRAIFAPVDTFTLYDPRFSAWTDTLDEKLTAHEAECGPLTNANKTLAIEKKHIIETVVAPTSPTPEVRTSTPAPTRSTAEAARPSTPATQAEPRPGPLAAVSPVPDPDVETARRYKLAADRGDADAQLNLGMMYGTGRGGLAPDPREAARLYKLSADQGNALAQLQLAYMYENGDVLPKDWREAGRLYRLAADQGNAEAQANLADFYERGDAGLRKNACEAVRLRKLAAAQGNTYAERSLKGANATRCKP